MKQGPPLFWKSVRGISFILAALGAVVSTSCVSSELEVPATHPAHPRARAARLHSTEALTEVYALENAGTSAAEGSSSGSHAGHVHESPKQEASPSDGHSTSEPQPAASAFTCPMHPEIVRAQPGNCPICGMKLVPKKDAK